MKTLTTSKKLRQLKDMLKVIWPLLAIYPDAEIAKMSGLSVSTVRRLGKPETVSTRIQFGTVQSLAAAAGLWIEVKGETVEYSIRGFVAEN